MKKGKRIMGYLMITTLVVGLAAGILVADETMSGNKSLDKCAPQVSVPSTVDNPFKMIIRLWPHHHTDKKLLKESLAAFSQYRNTCDEVWLCTKPGYSSIEEHRESARLMAEAADEMRKIGVIPSIQIGSTIGHADGFSGDTVSLTWGTLVSSDGVKTKQCSCPRQPAFLSHIREMASLYAACKPGMVWLDDDLRIARHSPAREGCFCETCIGLFNKETKNTWTRETLVAAMTRGDGAAVLRKKWITFGQESLAGVARAAAQGVHSVSPKTRMGLQHYNGHTDLLNGYDWKPIFRAFEEETGWTAGSRPGSGFYNDHAPRGMIEKALGMARQIRRLPESIQCIAPEVEGYQHWATGKSAHGLAVESMLYLSMGADSLSYAILCSAFEPMEWYASTYLSELAAWRSFYETYVRYNAGTQPGGVQPFMSQEHAGRPLRAGENARSWMTANPGRVANDIAVLGLPLCPDGVWPVAIMLDAEAVDGMTEDDARNVFSGGVLVDTSAWDRIVERRLNDGFKAAEIPSKLKVVRGFTTPAEGRVACVSYNAAVSAAQRNEFLQAADWVARGRLPVVIETMAQMMVVSRVDKEGTLRSVTVLNASIGTQKPVTLRLRGCRGTMKTMAWMLPKEKPVILPVCWDALDALVTLPAIGPWQIGWIRAEE
ncbi:MAG: hypothetical protein PHR77_15985 [Kiritimatiellae bacterium]|nr:hypothetical protein [Kiritimatiellia bacterium]MDD5523298.1 hypothetical protein [Kiritimatiellia bacterium]